MEHDKQDAPPRPCSASCSNPCFIGRGLVVPEVGRREPSAAAPEPVPPTAHESLAATPQRLLADDSVKLAMLLTAQMFGLPRQIVLATVLAGLPALARLAECNSLLLARLYAGSRQPMLTSIERFYARLAESPFLHQTLLDDHRAMYGGMLDSVNRAAGQYAGITDGQAQGVLATLLPALNYTLGQASGGDEREYTRQLKELGS
ncbi:MAG: hypothetical protein KC442_22140 [Thermomicrobiales bacterium]|nr:hypothetical protein [Thermomicrobiales bacterium]